LGERQPYMVRTGLFSIGPGKGWNDKEDHTETIDRLWHDSREITVEDGLPKAHVLPSLHHQGSMAKFYFSPDFVFLMDNPDRRGNFGLLGGNSKNHGVFGYNIFFDLLEKPFESCDSCPDAMVLYSEMEIWEKDIPEPTCGVCHGFSLKDVVKSGKYKKQPCVKPKKVVIEEQILIIVFYIYILPFCWYHLTFAGRR
jgi:hypothetical protein